MKLRQRCRLGHAVPCHRGWGFLNISTDETPEVIVYRHKAYAAMQKLIEGLGSYASTMHGEAKSGCYR